MIPLRRAYHPSWKVAVSIATPLLIATGILGCLIAPTQADAYLNSELVIAFSAVGWAVGMIISPDSAMEEKKFSGIWKGISLFLSGYLVSKIDPLVETLLKPETVGHLSNPLVAYRLLAAVAAVIFAAILTYAVRAYAFTTAE